MKRLYVILLVLLCTLFSACFPEVLSEEFYYYHGNTYYPTLYINSRPYYRVYMNSGYRYHPVPKHDYGRVYRKPPHGHPQVINHKR